MKTPEEKVKCAICGTSESLIYHHNSYEPEIIRVLCRSCHSKVHHQDPNLPKRPKSFESQLINNHFLSTTKRIKRATYTKIIQARGAFEVEDGKKRSINDVVSELACFFIKYSFLHAVRLKEGEALPEELIRKLYEAVVEREKQ